ncbi:MAG TPA: DUF5693 family protein [Trueperaceae bacterium]
MRPLLWVVLGLSLIPALFLVGRRISSEGSRVEVAMVMDEQALADQADLIGLTSLELARRYQALGLTGIALYEDNPESLVEKGYAAAMLGSEMRAQAVARGEAPPPVPADSTVITALMPGALDGLIAKNVPDARPFEYQGRTWYVWPGDVRQTLPAGPDAAELELWSNAGFDIAYRPRNAPYRLLDPGDDFPDQASYLVYAGTQVAGHPFGPDEDGAQPVIDASQEFLTAIIEGTPQDGMGRISGQVPTVRLLSFNQDYVDRRLRPRDIIDKYLLAVSERNVRLLYLRPWTTTELGDPVANTEAMIEGLAGALRSEGYQVGALTTLDTTFQTNRVLRTLAAVGVLAGLALLAAAIPAPWGAWAAVAVLALGVLAAGLDWGALALTAALVFPVLGLLLWQRRVLDLLPATLVSLAGAVLLVAVGSERATVLAIQPFAGVAATLVVPPVLFFVACLIRERPLKEWMRATWDAQVRVWHVAIAAVALAAVALVLLRRGNDPVIGVSQYELAFRQLLGEYFARPRFKELIGHPMAVLGLGMRDWPSWLRWLMLTGGVVAQASVLNSFSHFHTPVLVSLERTVAALAIGLVVGLVALVIARWLTRRVRAWLA